MLDVQNIAEKAARLFKKFGFKNVTMDDVARETGISKKTLYQFVSDKNELIERVTRVDLQHFKNEIDKLVSQNYDPVKEIIELNKLIYSIIIEGNPSVEYDLRKYYLEIYEKVRKNLVDMFISTLKANIERGQKENIYRTDIDVDVIARLHISHIEQLSQSKIFNQEAKDLSAIAGEICRFHINGLITPKGQQLLTKHTKEITNQ